MTYSESGFSFSKGGNPLGGRLGADRTIVVSAPLTRGEAGTVAEQLTMLDAESDAPIRVVMSSVMGGNVDAGVSVYDLIRSLTAPVTMLGSGGIVGAGVLAFVGAPRARRFALPHARFRFEEPRAIREEGPARDLETAAEEAEEQRGRIVSLIAAVTGQSEGQVEADLSAQRTFDADEAADYGLVERVVQSRREVG